MSRTVLPDQHLPAHCFRIVYFPDAPAGKSYWDIVISKRPVKQGPIKNGNAPILHKIDNFFTQNMCISMPSRTEMLISLFYPPLRFQRLNLMSFYFNKWHEYCFSLITIVVISFSSLPP
jgi:hypothetical protein